MEQHNEQIRARITGTGNLLREIFACLFPVLGTLYAFSHAAVVLYLCAGVTGAYLPFGTCVPQLMWILLYFLAALGSSYLSAGRCLFLNADKHSPVSSARSTKRRVRGGCLCQWELKAPTDRSRSDCVHEQVAKRIANFRFTKSKRRSGWIAAAIGTVTVLIVFPVVAVLFVLVVTAGFALEYLRAVSVRASVYLICSCGWKEDEGDNRRYLFWAVICVLICFAASGFTDLSTALGYYLAWNIQVLWPWMMAGGHFAAIQNRKNSKNIL